MGPIIEQFQIYKESVNQHNYFNKITDERAFFEVFPGAVDHEYLESSPEDVPSYVRRTLQGTDGSLIRMFEDQGRVHYTKANSIRWKLFTEGGHTATILQNVEPDGVYLGLNRTEFHIQLDVDWFGPNDLLFFRELNEVPLIVKSDPFPDGQGYTYSVALVDTNPQSYFPIEYIVPGTRIIQQGSSIGEAQVNRGNVHWEEGASWLEFEVPMTTMGWEMTITDKALLASKNYRVETMDGYKGAKGNEDVLVNGLEMKFLEATDKQIDYWSMQGRSASHTQNGPHLDGITRRSLDLGPGLSQFMEAASIIDYPVSGGSLDLFSQWLNAAWQDKVDPGERNVTVYTGSGGLRLWQEWGAAMDARMNIPRDPNVWMGKTDAIAAGRNGIQLNKAEYREYFVEPFGKVRVEYMPFLDSTTIDDRKYKGFPIRSYEFIIFDYGYGTGPNSNILMLRNKERELLGYSLGAWGPLGPVTNGKYGNRTGYMHGEGTKNQFKYIRDTSFGVLVKDPSYLAWFRPNLA